MTTRALHARVAAAKGERGATVVEVRHLPVVGVMALRAVGAQAISVGIILRVAARAHVGRCPELHLLRMAVAAFATAMFSEQREIGECVIKRGWIQRHDVGSAAFVFGVAGVAARFFEAAVQSSVRTNILCDGLVAIHTHARLCGFVKGNVAITAICFELGMRRGDCPGQDQPRNTAVRRVGARRQ